MKRWGEALATCAVLFVGALAACFAREWHAPHPGAIVGLFLAAIGLGTAIARRQYVSRSEPYDYHGKLSTRAASARTLVFAAIAGLVVAAGGSYVVVLVLDEWTSLVLASVVGSAWIGSLPLVPMIVHRIAEREVEVGFDAVDVGSARTWLRDVERAEAREHSLIVIRRDGTQRSVPCATAEIARTFASLITERSAPTTIPPMLARAGRTLAAWRAELTSPDYRTALVSVDEAERVLLSGSASRDERIGAALVLASMGARDRVARAQHSFVDASMRVALERIVEDRLDDSWVLWTERDG